MAKEEKKEDIQYPRIILGLDVSTACIGTAIIEDTGNGRPKILQLKHVAPKIKSTIKGILALFMRKDIFEEEFIKNLEGYSITDVVIEEPLLSSNNVNTVATLLRFNGMISESVYRRLGIVPSFISSYDARTYSFPELMALRKYNKKGKEYPLKHIKKEIKDDHVVLFGSYPYDVDKKMVMMNMVDKYYPDIEWIPNRNGEIKKENYDACDALVCAIAYSNIMRVGEKGSPVIKSTIVHEKEDGVEIEYEVDMMGETYAKTLNLGKQE